MSVTPWMSSDAGSPSTASPLALVPHGTDLTELPASYEPRRVLVDEPDSIAPRRAISYPSPGSVPSRSARISAAIQAVLQMPVFPALTWTDLAGRDADDGFVGARLNALREDGWQVLHSVPVGTRGSDLDHVLIGPGGVFVITSRTHPLPSLRNSRFEAERAAKFLSGALGWSVEVTPVLVFVTALPQFEDEPEGVVILGPLDLPRYFRRRPASLCAADVAEVFEYARRSSTWS